MRVIYDDQIFTAQENGGVSRYFSQLINGLPEFGAVPTPGFKVHVNHHLATSDTPLIKLPSSRPARRTCRTINRVFRHLDRSRYDIYHPTYFDGSYMSSVQARATITTVYDMIPEVMPQYFRGYPHQAKEAYVRGSDHVICISNKTRDDLIKFFDVDPDKTSTIHLGVEQDRASDIMPMRSIPEQFILFVGSRFGYKNFKLAIEAHNQLIKTFPELYLVCVGGGEFRPDELSQMTAESAKKSLRLSATDNQVRWLMRRAVALIFPSIYEGFGLPIIEAMSQGCAVTLADASCFPEVADEAALYFDPDRPEEAAEAITRLMKDTTARATLEQAGRKRALNFTTHDMIKRTVETYRRAL